MEPNGFQIRHPPPQHELNDYITCDSQLFQTLHMGAAIVDHSRYQLVIDGLVDRPYSLNLDQLKRLPKTSITAFHECYGSPLKPPIEALWRIGNVNWTGVRLSHLLDLAGIPHTDEERFVWSEGLDRGVFAGVEADRYQKDLPLQKAMQPEVLVAYELNGETLSKERGGPVRLVVPGYFGTNSTKWLCRLSVQKKRAQGPYTTRFYNEVIPGDAEQTTRPVWNVDVNSMITAPKPSAVLLGSEISTSGWAWSDAGVEKVELTWDEGRTWTQANVQTRSEYGWQHFHTTLKLAPGDYTIIARATSISGEQQPLMGRRNHVHRVDITVVPG
ncbi:molybdopterin binding oxidoreductase [Cucurbitaria berberidis CBS 394.84]|uniref:Molybdopterin binding oxidoreductase n=1 Tax=Cucurbitaria berberidis CBS 394.84 TaxID=1168544 RepID=A0A9P4GH58_9PLEO|nr:molybdopterin binding oxidoreductase [Cucurbitaria berberidis CBS 394.84]KAF1845537.1 molybdopterin binding oxidoreductase [Cucurbitaria berberidis CBS 394.84]